VRSGLFGFGSGGGLPTSCLYIAWQENCYISSVMKNYEAENSYPDLYIAAKLFIQASAMMNKTLLFMSLTEDDFKTLAFYIKLAMKRSHVTANQALEVYEKRDRMYNFPYTVRDALNEADLLAFIVAKALRLKNLLFFSKEWHKDSVVDLYCYAYILYELFGLARLLQ